MPITPRTLQLMAVSGMLAPIAFTVLAAAATFLTPGYDSVRLTVSRLAELGQPYGWLLNLSFVIYCLLVQPLGPLLHAAAPSRFGGGALWLLVILYGTGGTLAGVFTVADERLLMGELSSDQLHHLAAALSFSSIVALALITPYLFRQVPDWQPWRRFSLLMAVLTLIFMVLFWWDVWPEVRGLLQRAFFITTMAWVFGTSLRLYLLAARLPAGVAQSPP